MIRYPTLPFVPSAIALGHLVGYAVAHPEAPQRAHVLAGHSHLWAVLALGALSGCFGLSALAHARSVDRRLVPRYGRLVQLGALGYWLLEACERVVHGGLDGIATEPALWWGLLLQTAVAGLLLALARSAARIGYWFGARTSPADPAPSPVRLWTVGPDPAVPEPQGATANRRRGPPVLTA